MSAGNFPGRVGTAGTITQPRLTAPEIAAIRKNYRSLNETHQSKGTTMSQNETVTETTVATAPEAPEETLTLTFNKKKIRRIVAGSTAAVAAVATAIFVFKKAEDNSVAIEPLEESDGFVVFETPVQD